MGGRELGRVVKRSGRQPSTPWSRRRSRARRGRLGPVSVCVVMRCAACVARSDGLGPRRVAPGSCCCSCSAARSAAASKGRIAGLPPGVSATPVRRAQQGVRGALPKTPSPRSALERSGGCTRCARVHRQHRLGDVGEALARLLREVPVGEARRGSAHTPPPHSPGCPAVQASLNHSPRPSTVNGRTRRALPLARSRRTHTSLGARAARWPSGRAEKGARAASR